MNEITFKAKWSGLETFVDKSRDFICWLGDVLGPHSKTDGFQYSRKQDLIYQIEIELDKENIKKNTMVLSIYVLRQKTKAISTNKQYFKHHTSLCNEHVVDEFALHRVLDKLVLQKTN